MLSFRSFIVTDFTLDLEGNIREHCDLVISRDLLDTIPTALSIKEKKIDRMYFFQIKNCFSKHTV